MADQAPSPSSKRRRIEHLSLADNPLEGKFRREPEDTVQISTWNVAGLATCNLEKWNFGFRRYVEAEDPHIISITEVKQTNPEVYFEQAEDFAFLRERYPYRYWSYSSAIVSKFKPVAPPIFGFPDGTEFDKDEGRERVVTLEFKECYVLGAYVPNSGHHFQYLDRRRRWNADFEPFIRALDAKKPVIWTGDFNVVRPYTTPRPPDVPANEWHSPDLQWQAVNWRKLAGTHEDEIKAHERLLGPQEELLFPRRPGRKFVDVWRLIKGEGERRYSHTSKKYGGFRIDGFIVSERLLPRVRNCYIRYSFKKAFWPERDVVGRGAPSDHIPVWLSLEMERGDFEDVPSGET
ncbi:hypothetical protein JCM10212_000460 [Sporobolomyces blumeae]